MNTPRFTDQHRYPVPYRTAAATNIRETFARVMAQQKRPKRREQGKTK